MSARMPGSKFHQRKAKQLEERNRDMDFISNLPDSIRYHIISFLSMENAVRTSVLSKQWRKVCFSLPNFHFHQKLFEEKTNKRYDFKEFVEQTIRRHDGSSIQTFSLTVNVKDSYPPQIISWISFALRHKVKDLWIDIPKFGSLPDCLFTCETLTTLDLCDITLNIPSDIKLPRLKVLELFKVQFIDNNQTSQLVSNCLRLESLSFTSCSWKNTDDLIIHSLNLKTLMLSPSCAHNIRVHCPKLTVCLYSGNPPDISLETLSSLVHAIFGDYFSSAPISALAPEVVDQRLSKILTGLSNVVDLSLNQFWLEEQDEHTDMFNMEGYIQQQNLPIKDYLKHLKQVTIDSFEGSDYGFYLVRHLLDNANILEKMEIRCSKKYDEDEPRIASITEKITQFVAVSPYVTTSVCSTKDWLRRLRRIAKDPKS